METYFLLKAAGYIGVPTILCFGLMFWIRQDLRELAAAINKLIGTLEGYNFKGQEQS